MPTIDQIRAARALLDWSQADLAEHAGLSQTGIARIENGTNKPNSQTLTKIKTAFDKADIEFLGETGIRKRVNEIKTLHGKDGFKIFMDDVYETSKKMGGEICLFNGMPSYFIKHLGEDWYQMHSERMDQIKNNIRFRILVKEGERLFIASRFAEYRWFPKELFKERTFYSYGNKLALLSFDDDEVVIQILPQPLYAESFRVLFNIAWNHASIKPTN